MNLNDLYKKYAISYKVLLEDFSAGKIKSLIDAAKAIYPESHYKVAKRSFVDRYREEYPTASPGDYDFSLQRWERNYRQFNPDPPVCPYTDATLTYIFNRYNNLCSVQGKIKPGDRDIDEIFKRENDPLEYLINIVLENTEDITALPEDLVGGSTKPEKIIDTGGVIVWKCKNAAQNLNMRKIIDGYAVREKNKDGETVEREVVEYPALRASNRRLPENRRSGFGAHLYGWCVTYDKSLYIGYRTGQTGQDRKGPRDFYYVWDSNRPISSQLHFGVIQPLQQRKPEYDNKPITFCKAGNNGPIPDEKPDKAPDVNGDYDTRLFDGSREIMLSVDDLVKIYPQLEGHTDKIVYTPPSENEDLAEKLKGKSWSGIDKHRRDNSTIYVMTWMSVNKGAAMPLTRFLQLNRGLQNRYIQDRDAKAYNYAPINNNGLSTTNRLFIVDPLPYASETTLPITKALGILIKAGKTQLARNIAYACNSYSVAAAAQNPILNRFPILVDEAGLPIIENDRAKFSPYNIVERLPKLKKVIYGHDGEIFALNSFGQHLTIPFDDLEPEDKELCVQIQKVMKLIPEATSSFSQAKRGEVSNEG